MEFAYLVCVGGISLGTMGVFQYLYASATGGPDERLWGIASPLLGCCGLALLALIVIVG